MPALPVAGEPSHNVYGALLARHVTAGGVQYEAWRQTPADVTDLAAAVARMEEVDTSSLSLPGRFALYINLYNAKVLELVVLENPPRSVSRTTGRSTPRRNLLDRIWFDRVAVTAVGCLLVWRREAHPSVRIEPGKDQPCAGRGVAAAASICRETRHSIMSEITHVPAVVVSDMPSTSGG